jgi:hypothetical protein
MFELIGEELYIVAIMIIHLLGLAPRGGWLHLTSALCALGASAL